MNIPINYLRFSLFYPLVMTMLLCLAMAFYTPPNQPNNKKFNYEAWTIHVNDYADVHLNRNGRIFCGQWKVPIREHLSDSYCILRNGHELLPISWTTSSDSLIYEEFMDAVIDTMRTMALQEGYVSRENKTW